MSTIGEALLSCRGWNLHTICAALGVDPATPLANLVALRDGEVVVTTREAARGDHCLDEFGTQYELMWTPTPPHDAHRWVVVREAVRAEDAWEGETCDDCGGRYERTIWTAPDELWQQLVGKPSGLLCPPCFDDRAKAAGLFLRWVPRVEHREAVPVRAESEGEQA